MQDAQNKFESKLLKGIDIPPLYTFENTESKDVTIKVKLFALGSAATWLISEYDPEDGIAFGYADIYGDGTCAEWGYIDMAELESLMFTGFPIEMLNGVIKRVERDVHFAPRPFGECVRDDGTISV